MNGGTFQNVRSWRWYHFHLESQQPMASIKTFQGQRCFTPILIPYSKGRISLNTFREMCLVVSLRYKCFNQTLYTDNLCLWMLPTVSLSSPFHVNFNAPFIKPCLAMCHRWAPFFFSTMKVERSRFNIIHKDFGVWRRFQNQGQELLIPQDGAGGDVGETTNEP